MKRMFTEDQLDRAAHAVCTALGLIFPGTITADDLNPIIEGWLLAAGWKPLCRACNGDGWIVAENSEHGTRIERCDDCERFTDDAAAVIHVAQLAKVRV